ncbi:MAG: glycoside hydrolase family 2 TIM barrel-domain containing protein, partial [Eubacteriales bacterium]|nr:glycoside hydrolase family 2 TIM barrel-domain containing protein [Eubacteriales bacterium]
LIRDGIIKEPLEGWNSCDSEWIERKSWWFRKSFNVDDSLIVDADVVELVMESLDIGADIFVNNREVGRHISAFYPFRIDVKSLLKTGENCLIVRLTTGLDMVDLKDCEPYKVSTEGTRKPGRGDKRRTFLRKPQYSYGWDWGPRVATCGIPGRVWLESHKEAAIRGVRTYHVWPAASEGHTGPSGTTKSFNPARSGCTAELKYTIEIENFNPVSTLNGIIRIKMSPDQAVSDALLSGKTSMAAGSGSGSGSGCDDDIVSETDVLLRSGLNYINIPVRVKNAKLWWPNGMGGQPLYIIKIEAEISGVHSGDTRLLYPEFKYGIRTVSVDMARLREGEKLFAITINNVRTFCKGGNWIPADSIYSRVTDAKYERLITEAAEANFNMLRIWGGGLYERDIFYEMCDRHGIMVWNDMMFACSDYPEDRTWFMEEVEREMDYQTKRLRNHPSLVLWSGNNENQANGNHTGLRIYNYLGPAAVQRNCPDIPYWNSSPYGGARANDSEIGDRHHWGDCMMNREMIKRIVPEEYDKVTSKFISEYGYVGPLKRTSVEKYLSGAPFDIQSDVWQHHNNAFEKDTVLAGIRYHYRDTENMDIDNYLMYAGLCQGLMYAYSLEALRFKAECSGSLFWMYNDCWGETGWTIIDYYLVRKISYYYVKRAFSPVKLIMRCQQGSQPGGWADMSNSGNESVNVSTGCNSNCANVGESESGGQIMVAGINETPEDVLLEVEYGYAAFDGKTKDSKKVAIMLPHFSRGVVLSFEMSRHDIKKGTYFARADTKAATKAAAGTSAKVADNSGGNGSIDSGDGRDNSDSRQPVPLALLRMAPRRDLEMPPAKVQITGIKISNDKKSKGGSRSTEGAKCDSMKTIELTVESATFAHAVHFRLPDEIRLSDEYFDLLPGESRKVVVYDLPGNMDFSKITAYAENV